MYPEGLHHHGSTLLDPCTPNTGRHVEQESMAPRCLSRAEVASRAAGASTENERRHWPVIALQVDGRSTAEIVAATGYHPRAIRNIAQRYRESGPAALVD